MNEKEQLRFWTQLLHLDGFQVVHVRQDTPADRPVLDQALEDFRKSDYHFKELMVALVKSREFPDSRRTGNVAGHH